MTNDYRLFVYKKEGKCLCLLITCVYQYIYCMKYIYAVSVDQCKYHKK